jgi:molybdopterin biosynthesis enzyme
VSVATRHGRLSPQHARARWTEACAVAGWRGCPAPGEVHVADGRDRVLAEPVRARWPSPRCDCAATGGIAIAGPAAAGEVIAATAFAWVDTGDPIPGWADTVVAREQTEFRSDGSAVMTAPAPRGLDVRTRGEDFVAGALLVPAGPRLHPADLAAAAAAGHTTLVAARQPVVAIVPAGDEIRPVGTPLRQGDIVDSNSVMLAWCWSWRGPAPGETTTLRRSSARSAPKPGTASRCGPVIRCCSGMPGWSKPARARFLAAGRLSA